MSSTVWVAVGVAVLLLILIVVGGAVYILQKKSDDEGSNLVIYSYTSFEQWGLGPETKAIFEEKYGINVTLRTHFGDMGQVLSAVDRASEDERPDLVIGVDNSFLKRALELDLLDTYRPDNISRVNSSLIFDTDFHVVPYDYGYIAMICSREMMEDRGLPYPSSIMDLADDVYRDQLMLMDPTLSSTGSSFLIWAASVAGDDLKSYLEDLSDNAYMVLSTWDAMYSSFMAGEAPIGISYGLDTASEMIYYGTNDTVTIVPDDEGYRQIEGAGIVKGARNRENAELFLEFMLSDDFQSRVGYNVMLPVVDSVEVDPTYIEHGEFADVHVEPSQDTISINYDEWLDHWEDAFSPT